MYRGSWLLVGLPLLIAALSMIRPSPLTASRLPPTFDRRSAQALAVDLARRYPNRVPGSAGAIGGANWFRSQLQVYGFLPYRAGSTRNRSTFTQPDPFRATIPGRGSVDLENVLAVVTGTTRETIVVMAHRDDGGVGPGTNDNASGTAALVELARAYAVPVATPTTRVQPSHTIVFLSTDGGVYGGLGAAHFSRTSAYRDRIVAVINLDAIAGRSPARLEIAGEGPRSPPGVLVETAAARVFDQTSAAPLRPSVFGQLLDLGFPLSLYEHAPFLGSGTPALTLTTSGTRPRQAFGDAPGGLDVVRLGQLGRAAQTLLTSLDQGPDVPRETTTYLYLGTRLVRGWAIELALIAMLVPFLAAAIDLFARCRRRGIAMRPAFRAYRARLAFWLLAGGLFELFALIGVWPKGAARPPDPAGEAAGNWPALGLAVLLILVGAIWLAARGPLAPRGPVDAEQELAGHTTALLALAVVGLLAVATNPYSLVFCLPSLHAWLWLPQVRSSGAAVRGAVLLAGFSGPALLLGSLAVRFGLGLDAPWYLAELVAVGYVGLVPLAIALAWVAGAGQIVALTAGRYAPYPDRRELPRGPLRQVVRGAILTILRVRAQRRHAAGEERALEG